MSSSLFVLVLSLLCFCIAKISSVEEVYYTPEEYLTQFHPNAQVLNERALPQFIRSFNCHVLTNTPTCMTLAYDVQVSGRWWARNCCTLSKKPIITLDMNLQNIKVRDDCVRPSTELALWWMDDNLSLTPRLNGTQDC